MSDEPAQRDTPETTPERDGPTPSPTPSPHAALRRLPVLPRRSAQRHLEPQLRETRGVGSGTPFAAFDPPAVDGPQQSSADGAEQLDSAAGTRPADRGGARRGGGDSS